jgi:hypothetical protein
MMAGVRARAEYLNMSMSGYVAALIHNDLVRGIQAPLSLDSGGKAPVDTSSLACAQTPRGIAVDLDLP